MTQRCLPRPVSDHFLILLDNDGVRMGPSPFCFELMWLKYEGFKEILKGWWQNLQIYGSSSFILSAKLKALKGILKAWNREVFGKVEANKEDALRRVMSSRRKGDWTSRKLRNVLKPELISKVGPYRRRSPGDRNPERHDLRKGIGIRVSITGWLTPTGEEIASKAFASMAES